MPLGGEPSGELRQANCLSVLSIDLDLNFYLYNFQFIREILFSLWSYLYFLNFNYAGPAGRRWRFKGFPVYSVLRVGSIWKWLL